MVKQPAVYYIHRSVSDSGNSILSCLAQVSPDFVTVCAAVTMDLTQMSVIVVPHVFSQTATVKGPGQLQRSLEPHFLSNGPLHLFLCLHRCVLRKQSSPAAGKPASERN